MCCEAWLVLLAIMQQKKLCDDCVSGAQFARLGCLHVSSCTHSVRSHSCVQKLTPFGLLYYNALVALPVSVIIAFFAGEFTDFESFVYKTDPVSACVADVVIQMPSELRSARGEWPTAYCSTLPDCCAPVLASRVCAELATGDDGVVPAGRCDDVFHCPVQLCEFAAGHRSHGQREGHHLYLPGCAGACGQCEF